MDFMPVELDKIPTVSIRPDPPKLSRWLIVLMTVTGFSFITGWLLMGESSKWFFLMAPATIVGCLWGIRYFTYLLRQIHANAWDRQREKTILREMGRGRRALQILAVESCTAWSGADAPFSPLSSTVLKSETVFFPQRSWRGENNVRMSQLVRSAETGGKQHLGSLLITLAKKLAPSFSLLPVDTPVRLLLEFSSSLTGEDIKTLWQRAWIDAGIMQPYSFMDEKGFKAVESWLDRHINSNAVLLVISLQYMPEVTAMSAEAVSGILFGNRMTQRSLVPLALLQRPEAQRTNVRAVSCIIKQSLDWVPVSAMNIRHLWLSGIDISDRDYVTLMSGIDGSGIKDIDEINGVHNLNNILGEPGVSSPWLAISIATQLIQENPQYHLLINRERRVEELWSVVISPIATAREKNI